MRFELRRAGKGNSGVKREDSNVFDVTMNYLRRKIDSRYDRALILAVRGFADQISMAADAVRTHATAAH